MQYLEKKNYICDLTLFPGMQTRLS